VECRTGRGEFFRQDDRIFRINRRWEVGGPFLDTIGTQRRKTALDSSLSCLGKCVAAFVNLEPRRKKSVDILIKSSAVLVKNMGNLVKSAAILTKGMGILVKNMGNLTKSAAILVKNMGNLTKNTAILVKNMGILIKSSAILVKSEGILVKSKGTPTLSPIILLILLILSKPFLPILQSPANPV